MNLFTSAKLTARHGLRRWLIRVLERKPVNPVIVVQHRPRNPILRSNVSAGYQMPSATLRELRQRERIEGRHSTCVGTLPSSAGKRAAMGLATTSLSGLSALKRLFSGE